MGVAQRLRQATQTRGPQLTRFCPIIWSPLSTFLLAAKHFPTTPCPDAVYYPYLPHTRPPTGPAAKTTAN